LFGAGGLAQLSLEKIDRYMSEIEAVKNYEKILKERDLEKEKRLAADAQLAKERSDRNLERQELEKKIEELGSLETLSEGGKTLGEIWNEFFKRQEAEIDKRAQERFEKNKAAWETGEKPKEIMQRAVRLLESALSTMSQAIPFTYYEGDLSKSQIPELIRKTLDAEVEHRMDTEFQRSVNAEADRKAGVLFSQLKQREWPNFIKLHVEPRSKALEYQIRQSVMATLAGGWTIPCDKCLTEYKIRLSATQVAAVIGGHFDFECKNPACRDFLAKHKIRVTLLGLVERKLLPRTQQ
jgi:hypothetical protein